MSRFKQKLLQSLYRPRKSKVFSSDTFSGLQEVEKALEKAVNRGKDTLKYFKDYRQR